MLSCQQGRGACAPLRFEGSRRQCAQDPIVCAPNALKWWLCKRRATACRRHFSPIRLSHSRACKLNRAKPVWQAWTGFSGLQRPMTRLCRSGRKQKHGQHQQTLSFCLYGSWLTGAHPTGNQSGTTHLKGLLHGLLAKSWLPQRDAHPDILCWQELQDAASGTFHTCRRRAPPAQ